MNEASRLRLGILMALTSTGAITAIACGGDTSSEGNGKGGTSSGGASTGGASSGGASSGGASSGGASSGGASSGGTGTGGVSSGGVSSGGASSGGASTGGSGGAPPPCSFGTAKQSCYTLDQLEVMINSPPQGGDVGGDGGIDAGIELTECPEPSKVSNSCCNPATAGPIEQGDTCCYWFCEGACCGRPFVIDGHARVAAAVLRTDWLIEAEEAPSLELDSTTRRALAQAWLRDAQMEHASIASFARFTLELLALAAPPDLIADAQRASLDEIEHARLCFALAARFGEAPVGPAPLDVSGSGRTLTISEVAAAAVAEGCVGETIAALMAREQAARASDGAVKRALARIAEDEERHAALAWRFVRWALAQGDDRVRATIESAFASATRRAASAPHDSTARLDADAWARYGRLLEADAIATVASTIDDVIVPCAEALLADRSGTRAEHSLS